MQHDNEEIRHSGQEGLAANERVGTTHLARHDPARDRRRLHGLLGGRGQSGSGRLPRAQSRITREMTLEIAAKEYVWLWDRRHGCSIEAIAAREGLSVARVRFGVARAQAQQRGSASSARNTAVRPPRLVPLFPIGAYTPQSTCAHRRPIEPGSALCCMVCHTSGMDRHPALRRDPRTDPAPEPKPAAPVQEANKKRETRKERRQRLFGAYISRL